MGFWFFMTCSNFTVPVLMIVVGKVLIKNPPKTINGIYGYRTKRSRVNQNTWDFAQLYCGKLWWKIGWIMLPFSIIGMLPVIGKNDDFVGIAGAVIITIQCIIMFVSIFFVERALKRKFRDFN